MRNIRIGIFDSGLGGLTAYRELRAMTDADVVYFGDTGRVPYGTKSPEIIKKYAVQDAKFLISQGVDAILVACGTASSIALPTLVEKIPSVPFVGVVSPAAAAAVKDTRNGKIGVIGTPATIRSGAFTRAIANIDRDIEVHTTACPLFVSLVESGFIGGDNITLAACEHYLAPLRDKGIDTLILGCTHFPIIASEIARTLPNVTLIDTGREAARAILRLFSQNDDAVRFKPTNRFYVSDDMTGFAAAASLFLNFDVKGEVGQVMIEDY